ncbi:uncharacterized protein LOC136042380 isoform X2 [Artemia franciscana]
MKGYDQRLFNYFELEETCYNMTLSLFKQELSVKIGFAVCGIRYSSFTESHFILKYFLIVLPLGGVAATAFMLKYLIKLVIKVKKSEDGNTQLIGYELEKSCPMGCDKSIPYLGQSLSFLVLWHLIIKPLVIFCWWSQSNNQGHVYVDIGSHVILIFVAVLCSMSKRKESKPLVKVFTLDSSKRSQLENPNQQPTLHKDKINWM